MPVTTSEVRPRAAGETQPTASRLNRVLAWLATGPIGRVTAFLMDFGAAVLRAVRSR